MYWGADYNGITRFLYMFPTWFLDIFIAFTGVVTLSIGLPLNFIFWILELVYWFDDVVRVDYLNYMGFPNGGTTYYKMSDTFDTLTGDVVST